MLILTRKPCSKKKLIKKMIFVLITYVIVTVMFIKIDNNTFFDDLCYGSPYRRIFYVVFGMLIAMYTNFENNTKINLFHMLWYCYLFYGYYLEIEHILMSPWFVILLI